MSITMRECLPTLVVSTCTEPCRTQNAVELAPKWRHCAVEGGSHAAVRGHARAQSIETYCAPGAAPFTAPLRGPTGQPLAPAKPSHHRALFAGREWGRVGWGLGRQIV